MPAAPTGARVPMRAPAPAASPANPSFAPAPQTQTGRPQAVVPQIIIPRPRIATAEGQTFNILPYSNLGGGKTTFGATAQDHPEMSPVLVASFEGGLMSITGRGDINHVPLTSISELEALFYRLRAGDDDAEYRHYKTIMLDSGSELQTLCQQEVVDARVAALMAAPGRVSNPQLLDRDFIAIDDYGKVTARLKRIFRWYRDLPRHVIITALPRFVFPNPEASTPSEVYPNFTKQLATAVMSYMDMVWFLYVETKAEQAGQRRFLTQTSGAYQAKTRGMSFPRTLGAITDKVTLPEIYEIWKEAEAKDLEMWAKHTPLSPVAVRYMQTDSADSADALGALYEAPVAGATKAETTEESE